MSTFSKEGMVLLGRWQALCGKAVSEVVSVLHSSLSVLGAGSSFLLVSSQHVSSFTPLWALATQKFGIGLRAVVRARRLHHGLRRVPHWPAA